MSGKYLSEQSSWPYDLLARLVPLDAGAAQRRQVTVREEQRDRREEVAHFQANMRDLGGAMSGGYRMCCVWSQGILE